ncbi:MAG: ParA family protein [Clostridia bacterium]|nr:ParA family protein [Clostridia bacterium]
MSEKNVTFHVVNSVKGGSGKSTVSLFLAAAHAQNPQNAVYIIDLDLRGTSWEHNYIQRLDEDTAKDIPYINNLMYNMHDTPNPFVELPLSIEPAAGDYEECSVNLCRINPDAENNIDELAVDLFEDAIFRIIKKIYTDNSNKGKDVHIILDMPPSYEMHAERILRNLLLDMKSSLQRLADEEYKDVFEPYKVELIMLSALDYAHINQNTNYIRRLFRQQSMSSNLNEFIKKDKPRFRLKAWGNNLTNRQMPDRYTEPISQSFDNIHPILNVSHHIINHDPSFPTISSGKVALSSDVLQLPLD